MRDNEKSKDNFLKLLQIMDRLRAPDGCPWDKIQSAETLKNYLLEEAYEVLSAIEDDDAGDVCEELGDLMFLIIFLALVYEEPGLFNINDVMESIAAKMTRRHPHVFGNAKCVNASEVKQNWHRIKGEEKTQRGVETSFLGSIPIELPALMRAQRIGKRAARVGFDWENTEGVWEKLDEELSELKEACAKKDPALMSDELGDVLFTLVNLSRHLEINAEQALRNTLNRFLKRLEKMRELLEKKGKSLDKASPAEMDAAWERSKADT